MNITYSLHIMWYEYELIKEHFSSLSDALELVPTVPIRLVVCSNNQTYMEQPIDPDTLYNSHNLIRSELEIISKKFTNVSVDFFEKTNNDELYNVGDFRRDIKNDTGYICWGEIDCLLPTTYFYLLAGLVESVPEETFCVTFASRKMWDSSWTCVEHEKLKPMHEDELNRPYKFDHYISQEQLNTFNSKEEYATLEKIYPLKVDGALFSIYKNKFKILPEGLHFGKDDTIAAIALQVYGVPQYHIGNVLKGHNYYHPKKRSNTEAKKHDGMYKKFYEESSKYGDEFINELLRKYHAK